VYIKLVEILEGWGRGVVFVFNKWKFREGGELKGPSWLGYGYFLELQSVQM